VYLPAFRPVSLSPPLRRTYASDVAFIGNVFHPPVPDERIALRRFRLLRAVARRYRLKVWGVQGDPTTRARWAPTGAPLYDWPAFHDEVVRICQAAAIVLGINTVNDVELYFSNRTFVTLAAGGFHVTHYVPGLETMFENHRHLVWFHDDRECLDLIRHYLARPAARRRIAAAGCEWTRRRYGMARQVSRLLALLEAPGAA
jgi:spore maturation protein CgeB